MPEQEVKAKYQIETKAEPFKNELHISELPPGHIHSFIRHKPSSKSINPRWKCSDPDCMYYITQDMIEGKRTLCPHCLENTWVLSRDDFKRAEPRCPQKCSLVKEHIEARDKKNKVANILENLLFQRDTRSTVGDD